MQPEHSDPASKPGPAWLTEHFCMPTASPYILCMFNGPNNFFICYLKPTVGWETERAGKHSYWRKEWRKQLLPSDALHQALLAITRHSSCSNNCYHFHCPHFSAVMGSASTQYGRPWEASWAGLGEWWKLHSEEIALAHCSWYANYAVSAYAEMERGMVKLLFMYKMWNSSFWSSKPYTTEKSRIWKHMINSKTSKLRSITSSINILRFYTNAPATMIKISSKPKPQSV